MPKPNENLKNSRALSNTTYRTVAMELLKIDII